MIRIKPGIGDAKVHATLEGVKTALEPTLYAKHLVMPFYEVVTNMQGEYFRIPFFIDPADESVKKAWQTGSLDIRHLCVGVDRTVTIDVMAAVIGSAPVSLSQVVCVLGAGAVLQEFTDYLIGVDLAPYDAIGARYTIDLAPAAPITFSTSLLWRPSLV